MSGKRFLDANVLVYAQDSANLDKRRIARETIANAAREGKAVISTQIMQEFYSAATRMLHVAPADVKSVLRTFTAFETVQVTPAMIFEAIDCSMCNQLSFWDALMVCAASAAGCVEVVTEDLSHGQTIHGVTVRNPFYVPPIPFLKQKKA